MDVVALANQKGGVGRTTTSVALARALVEAGRSPVLIDADPQATATKLLGIDPFQHASLADLLDQPSAGIGAAVVPTDWGISLVPAHRDLALRERGAHVGDEFLLREALAVDAGDVGPVLIDCPPSLGLLAVTALIAANRVVLVTEASFGALAAVDDFLDTFEKVRARYNPGLTISGVLVSKYRDTIEHQAHLAQLDEHFPDLVLRPCIPMRAAAEAPASTGLPLSELRRPGAAGLRAIYAQHAAILFSQAS